MDVADWRFAGDLHTHTQHSDGKGSVLDNALAAKNAGLEYVGITDHGPASIGLGVRAQGFERIKAEVRHAAKNAGIEVLFGCEANVVSLDGALDVPESTRKSMDVVLCGLHSLIFPKSLSDGLRLSANNLVGARVSRRLRQRSRIDNTKALVESVLRNDIDVVSHPGLKIDIDTAELARACAKRGTALEISAGHEHMTPEYVRLAAKKGAVFSVGSDAHTPKSVGKFERAIGLLDLAGLEPDQVINAAEVKGIPDAKYDKTLPIWPGRKYLSRRARTW